MPCELLFVFVLYRLLLDLVPFLLLLLLLFVYLPGLLLHIRIQHGRVLDAVARDLLCQVQQRREMIV